MLQSLIIKAATSYVPNAIRYAGTATGAVIVKNGLATGDTATTVGGAVTVLLTFAWSLVEKYHLLDKVLAS